MRKKAKLTTNFGRHKSIIAYLSANNLPDAAAALRTELNLGEDAFDAATAKKYETLLEKKWTSIVRLQKKACNPSHRIWL
jgi:platelet-activating factor acetylhydrolase IB subunit alpha